MTAHAILFHDPDKTLCNLRISQKEGRTAARAPIDIECDVCTLRVLREMQRACPDLVLDEVPHLDWPPGVGTTPPKEIR